MLKPLPRADLYFLRTFLAFAAVSFLALTALVVVGDVFQKTDDFAAYAEETGRGLAVVLHLMFRYYLAFAPGMVLQWMLPLVLLLAGVLTVSASCAHNEYTALRASGISLRRTLLPVLAGALLLGLVVYVGRDRLLPLCLRASYAVQSTIRAKGARPVSLVLRHGAQMQSVSVGQYDMAGGTAHNLRVEVRKAAGPDTGDGRFDAYVAGAAQLRERPADVREAGGAELQWVPEKSRTVTRYGRYVRTEEPWREPLPTHVTPAMLERQVLGEAVMSWSDLQRLEEEDLDVRLEMQRRLSEAWGCVALVLLGAGLVLRRASRGVEPNYIVNIVWSIVICACFLLLRLAFNALGEAETVGPAVAGWLPVILTGFAGGAIFFQLER